MRLLLDEMHAPAVAEALRRRGHDVIAVKERAELVGAPDDELLVAATAEHRAVVTENVKDFAALDRSAAARGTLHAGLVYTHPRRFRRGGPGHIDHLVAALDAFLRNEAALLEGVGSFTWWLAPTGGAAG
ncbi:MAG: DUF5615 family PIN-like protein [Actinomycetota bacterium]|nr:DUF5615 family PIN-like protein [Actinomycetota bacterium]